jgi:uncharacterized protein YndB with AHSA1/START domain
MNTGSYTRKIDVTVKPAMVFRALTKEVSKWWTTDSDDASAVGIKATFRFDKTFNIMLVKELIPDHRVVWECIEQEHINEKLSTHDEWVGTKLRWDIEPIPQGTRVTFVHEGLVPEMECYEICEAGWDNFFVDSFKNYLDTGVGRPYKSAS